MQKGLHLLLNYQLTQRLLNNRIILDLCGSTGAWSKPWRDAGFQVVVITLPNYSVLKYKATDLGVPAFVFNGQNGATDILVEIGAIYGIMAAPPCTMFSLARSTAKTPRDFKEANKIVRACMDIIWTARESGSLKWWVVENPMGYMRQFLGKPAMTFDPSEFDGDYNKTTDLWGYFNLPKTKKPYQRFASTDTNSRKMPQIPAYYVRDPNMRPQQIARSITHGGFAEAFFKANR